jgi:peptidyl-dipeptidase Dcp
MIDNPLLTPSTQPHDAPEFGLIKTEHYEPAVQAAITEARAAVEAIKSNPAPADFDNTIVAFETSNDLLSLVTSVFYNQLSANGNDDLEALAEVIGPIASNFASDIALDPVLFARIKTVYDIRETLNLTPEQITLLDDTYKGFVRNGALLNDAAKDRLRAIDERLSVLAPQFQKNLKKSTERFKLVITDKGDLEGLPASAIAVASDTAREKGHDGAWVFTLQAPSFIPVITYSPKRDIREQLWRAYNARAWGDENDNTATVLELVRLKHERAKLLGFHTHASYTLAERMAGSPDRVMGFIDDLLKVYFPAAKKDLEDLRTLARADGVDDLKPWDMPYYREKLQQQRFNLDSEELRPYFPIQKVLSGTFDHFSKLFGVKFVANPKIVTWHPDVTAYDVVNSRDDAFVGVLYADFFPRDGKQSGAWMTTYRDQGLMFGKNLRPIVAIVCNFTKPSAEHPSLLTHDEVLTLFHEMGHAMHMMLSDVTYSSLSGTNVKWDFVELPSQVQENWAYEHETLALVSSHVKTGAVVPDDLIRKLHAAKNFMAGMNGLRQMAFSKLDLSWYMTDPATITDIPAFEDSILKDISLFPRLAGPISTSFGHIFGGGYSAGYYSYKWAEVLDADVFELFKERGLYDAATSSAYRAQILSKGGSEDPNLLFVRFRGRAANADALLRREGLS